MTTYFSFPLLKDSVWREIARQCHIINTLKCICKRVLQHYIFHSQRMRDAAITSFFHICNIPFLGTYFFFFFKVAAKSRQLCPTLCDPIDGFPPGSPVPGILQARTLEWVAISFSNAWNWKVKVKSLSRVPAPSDPMDCSLPGSSVHGIRQARVLE